MLYVVMFLSFIGLAACLKLLSECAIAFSKHRQYRAAKEHDRKWQETFRNIYGD